MKKLTIGQEYKTKDGEVKTKWVNVGVLITKQDGKETVILDNNYNLNNFAKDGRVFLNVFEDTRENSVKEDNSAPF